MVFPALISDTPKVLVLLSDHKIFRSPLIVSPLLLTLLAAALAAANDAASVMASRVMDGDIADTAAAILVLCLKPPDPNLSTVFIIYISIIIILIKYHRTSHGCLISIEHKCN